MQNSRILEQKILELFSIKKYFSENLSKWEDNSFHDKYDFNYFEYLKQPSKDEFLQALKYQKNRNDNFIKFMGREALVDSFGLEQTITLTMELDKKHPVWRLNQDIECHYPAFDELKELELKHYAPIFGKDWVLKDIICEYEKLNYHGAYLKGNLLGSCYSYKFDNCVCIDGLLTDEDYRKMYIATTLINHIVENNRDSKIYLHADEYDTPKKMYTKMGFKIVDRMYEYTADKETFYNLCKALTK